MTVRCSPFARIPASNPDIPTIRLTIKFNPENGLNAVEIDQQSKSSIAKDKVLIPNS